jgi:hypothetical protein
MRTAWFFLSGLLLLAATFVTDRRHGKSPCAESVHVLDPVFPG